MVRTDQYEGLMAETVMMAGAHGDWINAYFARPLGAGPFPASEPEIAAVVRALLELPIAAGLEIDQRTGRERLVGRHADTLADRHCPRGTRLGTCR